MIVSAARALKNTAMLASRAAEHVESLKLSVSRTAYTMAFETGDADHARCRSQVKVVVFFA